MKRVPLSLLLLVLAGAQPQRLPDAGTYQFLVCRNGCGATGADTSRAYIAGWLVLGDTLSPDLQRNFFFDRVAENRTDSGPLPSNGCFQLDRVVEPPLSYAGNATGGRLHWRYLGASDTISFPLFQSPDAGYAVKLVRTGRTIRGAGHSWGAGAAAIAEPDDSIVGFWSGQPDARACQPRAVLAESGVVSVRGRVFADIDRSPIEYGVVTLEAAGFRQYRFTDSIGRFQFFFVPVGRYQLTIRALSYPALHDSIRVSRDTALTVLMPAHCQHDSASALRDIARHQIRVLLHSMLARTRQDAVVERRYGFEYEDFGDMVYEPFACEEQYNRVIFRYFDRRFGTGWRDSVRVP